jgi:hypothetical protein
MRGFWRCLPVGVAVILSSVALPLFAVKFDQTTGTKTDTSKFNGMSEEELLALKRLQNQYLLDVANKIQMFDNGEGSSKLDGQNIPGHGRYSNFGEAHMLNGMVAHPDGKNNIENAMETGALGKTGLTGAEREAAEKKEMEKFTTPNLGPDGKPDGTSYTNNSTGKKQTKSFDISAAIIDAGPAHPNPQAKNDDPHRVYIVNDKVRKAVEAAAPAYARKIMQDATLTPGAAPNLDVLHKAYSKLEQDKYIAMASEAFALRSARLEGTDTSQPDNKFTIGEYKQMAIEIYADDRYKGNITEAEKKIREDLAKRVAEKRVVGEKTFCPNGDVKTGDTCPQTAPATVAEKIYKPGEEGKLAEDLLVKLGVTQPDETKKRALMSALHFTPDPNKPVDPKGPDIGTLSAKLGDLQLKQLGGIVDVQQLNKYYQEAQQNLGANEKNKIAQYEQRLGPNGNNCLEFSTFCISRSLHDVPQASPPPGGTATASNPNSIDPTDYQNTKPGEDAGSYFYDTREMIFNRFADAYNKPLSQWKDAVRFDDFNENTDKTIRPKSYKQGQDGQVRNGQLYKEFVQMYDYAKKQADNIRANVDKDFVERLRSAGATPEQLAKAQNYGAGAKFDFDPSRNSMMQLFGQNVKRDAVMIEARKQIGGSIVDPRQRRTISSQPGSRTFQQTTTPTGTKTNTGPGTTP